MTLVDPMFRRAAPRVRTETRDWPHALRALRQLLNNHEDTGQVFEIMRALNGGAAAKGYRRLLSEPSGGRLAYERAELAKFLMDDAWLDSLPAGSVGAAYRGFIRSDHFSADGLAEISRRNDAEIDEPHPYAWFARKTRDVHDIWHVLTGYHRDALGEACLVAFSYAQTEGLGWAFIGAGALWKARKGKSHPYVSAIWQGYRRGKACAWLLGQDYERLMAEPLEAARRRLGLTPPTYYDAIPVDARGSGKPAAG